MKTLKRIFWTITIVLLVVSKVSFSQDKAEDIIFKAMSDELKRNIDSLKIEGLKNPFYIGYTITDLKMLFVNASLGSIIESKITPCRTFKNTILVGDYNRTSENYMDQNTIWSWDGDNKVVLDNDYRGIRHALWESTDSKYKNAVSVYEAKMSAIKQQNLPPEELALPDYTREQKTEMILPSKSFEFDKKYWENVAAELSLIFKDYNEIFSSGTSVYLYQADVYFLNSEQTKIKYPVTIAAVRVTANTQAVDGEPLFNYVVHYALTPDELPPMDKLKKEVKEMADMLVAVRNAPVYNDFYSGPVLFEGEAVAEIVSQKFFSNPTSLIANRKPILANQNLSRYAGYSVIDNALEIMFDKKIISGDLTIQSTPSMKSFNGVNLIGSYSVDAEGVKPPENLILVENGILKNLLSDRIPTLKTQKSNGHEICFFDYGGSLSSVIGPGVINLSAKNGISKEVLKNKLLQTAKENNYEYAFIVRKMENTNAGVVKDDDNSYYYSRGSDTENKDKLSKSLLVYKVNVSDGKEELVRGIEISGLSVKAFKRILGVSDKQFVYNTMITGKEDSYNAWGYLYGMPASFIVPDVMLFEELDIQKEKRTVTKKLPVVQNPVGIK